MKLVNERDRQVREFRYQEPARGGSPQNYVNYGFNGAVYSIEAVGRNAFLIGGAFTSYSQRSVNKLGLFRLQDNVLVLDESFTSQLPADETGTNGRTPKTRVYVTKVLPGGDILIGGRITKYGRQATSGLVHVDAEGGLVSTFKFTKNGQPGAVNSLALDYPRDGVVAVGGYYDTTFDTQTSGLVTMSRSGGAGNWSAAQTFRFLEGFDEELGMVSGLQLDSEGALYVSGDFMFAGANGNLVTRSNILRLDRNGAVDARWSPGGFLSRNETGYFYFTGEPSADEEPEDQPPNVYAILSLSGGGLLAGGRFEGTHNYASGQGDSILSRNLVWLSTNLIQDSGVQLGTSVRALRPDVLDDKAVTPKGFITVSGAVEGTLEPGEEVNNRYFAVGVASAEFGECQNLEYFPLPTNLDVAIKVVQALGNPGDYLCEIGRAHV